MIVTVKSAQYQWVSFRKQSLFSYPMALRLILILFAFQHFPETYFNICFNFFHTLIESQLAAVQTQVIVSCIIPFSSGVIAIVVPTVFIRFSDELLHLLPSERGKLQSSCHAIGIWRMYEYADNIGIIPQNEIRTPSDDHAGLFLCQFFDYLCLIVK